MLITDYKKDGITYINIDGSIDASSINFDKQLSELVNGQKNIIIDCKDLSFISSSGLRAFLTAVKLVTNTNGKIVICNLRPAIFNVFQMAGFTSIFKIYDNIDAAKAEFN